MSAGAATIEAVPKEQTPQQLAVVLARRLRSPGDVGDAVRQLIELGAAAIEPVIAEMGRDLLQSVRGDEELPARVRAWWVENQARFPPGKIYRYGRSWMMRS